MNQIEKTELTDAVKDAVKTDMAELKWENRMQTVFVLLAFFFGVVSIHNLIKK